MKCPKLLLHQLLLSRRCGGKEEELLLLDCLTNYTKPHDPRLHLDISSGCWTLPQAGRGDSCVYEVRDRGAGDKVMSSTSIRVLDPVRIYNISSNSSRLGEDIAVTVQYSGEESHVTWELDWGRLPERYRLIDDNRTLIIPSVQRDDAERTFRVRVTNPVSEGVRDHRPEIRVPEYLQTGSEVTRCGMKCLDELPVLLLSRRCGGEEEELLLLDCHTNYTQPLDPRLHLDISSGCWTLPQAGRGDSCVYEVRDRGAGDKVLSSTSIRVLDPVLIYNISSNSSRLGEDIAVTVQYSGEESHVTWELDGGRLPERYRLIDDNRTLIIPSVQRDDAERTFRVRVTNPVSNVSQDYPLEITDPGSSTGRSHGAAIAALLLAVLVAITYAVYQTPCRKRRRDVQGNGAADTDPLSAQEGVASPTQNGSTSTNQNEPLCTTENRSVPTRQPGSPSM
ncbi:uncharacterized protein [Hyperolius riggenbachi]|uniref:uncharacterized protein n=1 Tax=Hyperolius riggenbachi TaxID=752182 RepID=UPI0035A354BE